MNSMSNITVIIKCPFYHKLLVTGFYSAGVGRTGTFIALDYLMLQADSEQKVNPYQFVELMRTRRPSMIQKEVCCRCILYFISLITLGQCLI